MSDIVIRPVQPHELAIVAELRWRWMKEVHGTSSITLEEFVPPFVSWAKENGATHRCLVLLRSAHVLGMSWLAITQRVPHPGSFVRASGDVQCVYVVPEERDGGMGGRLIEATLTLAGDLGLERVTVHSSHRAVSAYARNGFARSPHLLQADVERVHTA